MIEINKETTEKEGVKEKDENSKKTDIKSYLKIIIPVAVVLIIVLLIIILSKSKTNTNNYNGFEFYKDGNLWNAYININNQDMLVPFKYLPSEVDELYVNPLIEKRIMALGAEDIIVLAVEEDANATAVVASVNLARLYKLGVIAAETHGGLYDENFNLTEYLIEYNKTGVEQEFFTTNCDYANNNFVIFRFTETNETKMDFANKDYNCITVTAKNAEDFRKLIDKLAYELLGIIKE